MKIFITWDMYRQEQALRFDKEGKPPLLFYGKNYNSPSEVLGIEIQPEDEEALKKFLLTEEERKLIEKFKKIPEDLFNNGE